MVVIAHKDHELAVQLGKVLRRMRITRKISNEKIAAAAGVGYSTLTSWEGGRNCPSLHSLSAVCRALDIPVWRVLRMAEMRRRWERTATQDASRAREAQVKQQIGAGKTTE
jgi:transcriptional regulator with XRE-family HTH domain